VISGKTPVTGSAGGHEFRRIEWLLISWSPAKDAGSRDLQEGHEFRKIRSAPDLVVSRKTRVTGSAGGHEFRKIKALPTS
jgi:hypothetical protein